MSAQRTTRERRTLKVVLGWACEQACRYCALVGSPQYARARDDAFAPALATERIREAAATFQLTGLEIGAGESFLHPDRLAWLVRLNDRETKLPIFLFTSLVADDAEAALQVLARSAHPVSLLVSYDGRRSARNARNWELVEERWRRARALSAQRPALRVGLTTCITPEDVPHLEENLASVLALCEDGAGFNHRPIKRRFSPAQRADAAGAYDRFLASAAERAPGFFQEYAAGPEVRRVKPDWSCHRLGISLLPDGSWTDCYVTHYCADFPAARRVASLAALDAFFDARTPASARCARCLDHLGFCNQCQAGLHDYRRATGDRFYEPAFCELVNRLALLHASHLFARYPGRRLELRRGAQRIRLAGAGDGAVAVQVGGAEPVTVDPRGDLAALVARLELDREWNEA